MKKNISRGYNKSLITMALCAGICKNSSELELYHEISSELLDIHNSVITYIQSNNHKYDIRDIKKISQNKVTKAIESLKNEKYLNPPLLVCKIIKNLHANNKTNQDIINFLNNNIINVINKLDYEFTKEMEIIDKINLNIKYRGIANRVLAIYFS